jgi:uncharacterized protein
VIALDSNILVYARRSESAHHASARQLVTELAEGEARWAIPWPCVYEFLRVVTHPSVFSPPTNLDDALDYLDELFASPSLTLLGEGPAHQAHLRSALRGGRATGNLAHDGHIAALAVEHGVSELWTSDRDFARFPGLRVRNPFESARLNEPPSAYRTRSTDARHASRKRSSVRRG